MLAKSHRVEVDGFICYRGRILTKYWSKMLDKNWPTKKAAINHAIREIRIIQTFARL